MYYSERYDEIIKILRSRNGASVHFLAEHLHISEPTIRRDLAFLEKSCLIRRTYGGAIINEMNNTDIPLILRESENNKSKELIAQKAVKFISDGNVIFLDASSTVSKLIKYLPQFSDLTIITNSPKNSIRLAELKIRSFCTGGLLLEKSIAYVGNMAEEFIKKFNADLMFMSCRGISDEGNLTDTSIEETELRKVMLSHSKKKILMCSGEKFGHKYMYNLCSVNDIDGIVCDTSLPDAIKNSLRI